MHNHYDYDYNGRYKQEQQCLRISGKNLIDFYAVDYIFPVN